MKELTNKQLQELRGQAQALAVTLQVGKNGITPATVEELSLQLKKKKLVKVRLLKSATEGGANDDAQAESLAASTASRLLEVRGHTAVYYRS
jgi:RNA-binding protein